MAEYRGLFTKNRIQSPCKGCEDRYLGCHGECEEYLAFKNKAKDYHKMVSSKKNAERILYSPAINEQTRQLRNKAKGLKKK